MSNGENIKSKECISGECPSDFTIERYHLDDLGPMEKLTVERAIEQCSGCAERSCALSQGFLGLPDVDANALQARILEGLAGASLPEELAKAMEVNAAEPTPRSTWSKISEWIFGGGGRVLLVSAAAIIMAIVLFPPVTDPVNEGDSVRLKGTLKLVVHRARGAEVSRPASGDTFKAGDRIRFEVTVSDAGHLMVLGQESLGTTYIAYPRDRGAGSSPIQMGRSELPGSLQLDGSLGREVLHTVFCPKPFKRADITISDPLNIMPDGCVTERFEMVKSK